MSSPTKYILSFSIGLGLIAPALMSGYAALEARYGIYGPGVILYYLAAQLFPLFWLAVDLYEEIKLTANCHSYTCTVGMILGNMAEYALIGAIAWYVRDNFRGQIALWAMSSAAVLVWSGFILFFVSPWIVYTGLTQAVLAIAIVTVFFLILFRPPRLVG